MQFRSPLSMAIRVVVCGAVVTMALSMRPAVRTEERGGQASAADTGRALLMKAHFSQVVALQDALMRGELAAATAAARAIADQPLPAGTSGAAASAAAAMRQAAERASTATTLGGAAEASAMMFVRCGDCHTAASVTPTTPMPVLQPPAEGAVAHMRDHRRGVEWLMEGLILPSTASWHAGATVLKTAPLRRSRLPEGPARTRAAMDAESRVHDWAKGAADLTDPAQRASSYAQLMTTCASCHRAQ